MISVRILVLALLLVSSTALAAVKSETVQYKEGDTALVGQIFYDDSVSEPRPGVLVVHEWWGLNDYAKRRAGMLAEAGYVALALDMYGEGKVTDHPQEAGEWAGVIMQNQDMGARRFLAAYEVLKSHEKTRSDQIAAIGYCFGGHVVLAMALAGTDLDGVVSFHGSLPQEPVEPGSVTAKLLVCHGGSDPFTTREQVATFEKNLTEGGVDWQLVVYGGAKHSFTSPEADERGMPPLAYDPAADRRSWQAMLSFFDEIFSD